MNLTIECNSQLAASDAIDIYCIFSFPISNDARPFRISFKLRFAFSICSCRQNAKIEGISAMCDAGPFALVVEARGRRTSTTAVGCSKFYIYSPICRFLLRKTLKGFVSAARTSFIFIFCSFVATGFRPLPLLHIQSHKYISANLRFPFFCLVAQTKIELTTATKKNRTRERKKKCVSEWNLRCALSSLYSPAFSRLLILLPRIHIPYVKKIKKVTKKLEAVLRPLTVYLLLYFMFA